MSTILVTGGAGYIGSHACKQLAKAGYQPVTVDNLSRGHRWAVKWGPLEVADIADRAAMIGVLQKYRPAAVLHFAAYAYAGESVTHPALYYGNNIVASWNLLEAMRETGVRHIVFSSTCATYGEMPTEPIRETAAQNPVSPYGFSKLAIERLLLDYSVAYGFKAVMPRYFNASGADPEGEIGELHDPEPHLIPNVLRVARGLDPLLKIFGDDYPTPDGTCVRDYIHVTDLADAHVLALRGLLEDGLTGAFNLGNGNGYSIKQVIDAARQITGREIRCEIAPRRAGDPPFAVGDASRARKILGWNPRHHRIETIIETAWRWMQIYEERRQAT